MPQIEINVGAVLIHDIFYAMISTFPLLSMLRASHLSTEVGVVHQAMLFLAVCGVIWFKVVMRDEIQQSGGDLIEAIFECCR